MGRQGLFQGKGRMGTGRGRQPQPGFFHGFCQGRQGLQGRQLGFQGRGKQGLGKQGRPPQMLPLMIELIFIFLDSNVFQIFGVSRGPRYLTRWLL